MSDPFARALGTADVNPDEAAKQDEAAGRLGVGREAVAADPELLKRDSAAGVAEELADAPATERWYNKNAELVADEEVPNLTGLERGVRAIGQTARSVGREGRLTAMRWSRMMGLETPIEGLRRRSLAEEARREPGLKEFEFESTKTAEPLAWLGLQTLQDVVQLGGAAAESIPFMAVTTAATLGAGPVAGFVAAGSMEGGGLFETMVDEYQIPEQVARPVAMAFGPAIGALEYVGTSKVLQRAFPKAAAKAEIGKALGVRLAREGMSGAVMRVLEGAAVEGGTEALQEVQSNLGVLTAQFFAGQELELRVTVDGQEYTGLDALLLSAIEAGKVGAVAGGGIGGVSEAVGSARDRKVADAKDAQLQMDGLLKAADASPVRERAPDRYVALVNEAIVEHGAAETVLVPVEKFRELFQAANEDARNELEAASPGITARVAEAEATGADVAIPTGMFVGRVAHTKIGQGLRKAWRTDPDAMTQEEGEREEARLVVEGREVVDAEQAPSPFDAYQREVEDQLVRAGAPVAEAQQAAVGERANMETAAEKYKLSFEEAVKRFGRATIVSGMEAAREDAELLQERIEEAGAFDRDVATAMLAEARAEGPSPRLFHETDPQAARGIIRGASISPYGDELFVADDPSLALGQRGKGVTIELAAPTRAGDLRRVRKPGAGIIEGAPQELRLTSPAAEYPGLVRSVRVSDAALKNKMAKVLVAEMLEAGFREEPGDGFRVYRKPLEGEALKRETRAAFRAEVERLGFDVTIDDPEDILEALENEAAENFAAAQDETELFQRSAVEGTPVARWLRGAELKGNKLLAANIAKVFAQAPKTGDIAAAALAGVAKRGWYRRSVAALGHVFGQDAPRFTALLAALSPQDSVQGNLKNALKVWRTWTKKGRPTDEDSLRRILNREMAAVTAAQAEGGALPSRIPNAIRSLTATAESLADRSFKLSGRKVDSFWRNLTGDMEAVTLDSWMATFFGLPKKKLANSKSAYLGLTAAVRKAAAQLTEQTGESWTPAEVQETIWSWAKALVEQTAAPAEFRTAEQIVRQRGIEPGRITSVPDFAGLLSEAVYGPLIEEIGVGERVREAGERPTEGPREGAEAPEGAVPRVAPRRAPLERAARRIERAIEEQRARDGRELAQRPGGGAAVERLRGLGLRVEAADDGTMLFVGHDGAKFTIEQLDTPDGMRAFHEAIGFPTDRANPDTIADLKVYRLRETFGDTVEQVEAKLKTWLDRIGWTFRRFGPGMGPDGKPYWPNFRDGSAPSYKDKVAFIFNEQVPEGSFFDPPYTLAWRVPHEVAHGLTNPALDERYGPGFRAGALGKVTRGPFFREDQARTLNEALRATDWEIETFKAQRAILEQEFGVDLTEEEFRKENAVNYTGALYRAITGQFADPNTVGVLPAALDPEQLATVGRALLEAVAAERGAEEGHELAQAEGVERGRFQYRTSDPYDLSKTRIILERSQNSSTALHELWHLWWARLEKQANEQLAEGAPLHELQAQAEAVVQWDRARKFVGAGRGEALTDRQLEKLARAGEAYVREGKAPSLALREMFDRYRGWLRTVYTTLLRLERDAGQPIRLTDDIRQVMDRILATNAQIAEAKRARGFSPPNEAAVVSLMTDDERADYEVKVAAADRETRERVAQKIHKIAKERRRTDWSEAVGELREVVTARVEARLDVRARTWLAAGEWRAPVPAPEVQSAGLDSGALREMYGKVPRALPPDVVQTDGLHPDVAADALGYTDGPALVSALEALGKEPTEKIVERELRARVKAELGAPDKLGREEIVYAMAEVSTFVDAVAITERALARKAGTKSVSKQTLRQAARRIVAGTPVVQLAPGKYRAAAEREGALAVKHAGAGAYGEAVAAKRRQLLSVFLEAEALKAKERADTIHDRLAWLQGATAGATLVRAGHTYADQIAQLLERFNLARVSAKAIARRQSLAQWVAEREADGETPAIPDHLRDDAYQKNWRELTVAELRDVADAADSIYHLARRKVVFAAAAKQRDRQDVRTDLVARLERVTKLPPMQRYTDFDDPNERTLGKKILSLGSALDKVIAVVDHLDGGDTSGPWHTYVYRPIADALGKKQDMARAFAQEYHDLLRGLVNGKEKQYRARIATDLPFLDAHGRPTLGRFTKLQLLGIASNLGNHSNMTKLLDGYGWTEEQVTAELQKHLTDADWRFVQGGWNLIEKLWPAIEAQERELNGVVPEKVIAREFTVLTADGKTLTLAGGYFPVVYDPDPSKTNWAHKNASRGLFEGVENHFMRAITGHGHTKARTEVTGPLLFDVAIIPRHLDEVIHDLAFRAVLLDVDVLLDNKDVRGALQRALGEQYATMFRPWLQSVAQDRVFEPQMMRPWNRLLSRVRVNATSAVLFFRDTTLLAQLSGHTPAIAEMRGHLPEGWAEDYREALRTAAQHPRRSAEFVRARSAFMRSRIDHSDRDRRDQVRQMQSQVAPGNERLRKAIAFGGALIANTQFYGVDVPAWIAAFNAAQRLQGKSERDAAFLADQIVKLSQGSGESIDLSEMQRGPEWQKMFTTFYSYVAAQWVAFVRDTRDLRVGRISKGEFMVRFGLRFTLPALYMTAVRALLPGGAAPPDLEDDEWWDKAWWALGNTGVFELAGAVPVLRDMVGWFKYGRVSPTVPAARLTQEAIELGAEVGRAVTEEVRPVELLTDTLNFVAMVTGLPLMRASDLIKEINEEEGE